MRIGVIGLAIIGFIALAGLFGSFYTVDAGEKAVVLRYGAVTGTADAGLHFKMPLADDVQFVSMRTDTLEFPDEGFYSKDQQAATATVSVTYAAKPSAAAAIYTNFGTVERAAQQLITRRVKKEFKEVMGTFTAKTSIENREQMGVEVAKAIIANENPYILIQSVQVENVDFSNAYEDAIEQRMLAEVGIETETQNLEKEKKLAEIKVTQEQAIADGNLKHKEAEAAGIKAIGEAQAEAIRAKGKALAENPNLVELVKAEQWKGVLPTHVLPNGTVPFLDVAK